MSRSKKSAAPPTAPPTDPPAVLTTEETEATPVPTAPRRANAFDKAQTAYSKQQERIEKLLTVNKKLKDQLAESRRKTTRIKKIVRAPADRAEEEPAQ